MRSYIFILLFLACAGISSSGARAQRSPLTPEVRRELAYEFRVERRLELEVETLERLLERKMRHSDAHGRVALLLAG